MQKLKIIYKGLNISNNVVLFSVLLLIQLFIYLFIYLFYFFFFNFTHALLKFF